MDYQRIYNEFIADRRNKEKAITGYAERHHIKPKSLGGDDSRENLIKLTAQDHYFAHELLAKIHGGKMSNALWMMTTSKKYKSSRLAYEQSRKKHIESIKPTIMAAITGRKKTETEIKKISDSLKKYFKENGNPVKGRTKTDAEKLKTKLTLIDYYKTHKGTRLGQNNSTETKEKLRQYMLSDKNHFRGKTLSDEHKSKIGLAQIGSKNHAYKKQKYKFFHEDYGVFIGTQNNLSIEFGLHKSGVSKLCLNKCKKHKGWVILELC